MGRQQTRQIEQLSFSCCSKNTCVRVCCTQPNYIQITVAFLLRAFCALWPKCKHWQQLAAEWFYVSNKCPVHMSLVDNNSILMTVVAWFAGECHHAVTAFRAGRSWVRAQMQHQLSTVAPTANTPLTHLSVG